PEGVLFRFAFKMKCRPNSAGIRRKKTFFFEYSSNTYQRYTDRLSKYTVADPLAPSPSTWKLVSNVEPHPRAKAEGTVAFRLCCVPSNHTDSYVTLPASSRE